MCCKPGCRMSGCAINGAPGQAVEVEEHSSFRPWPQRLRMFGRSVYVGPRPDGRLAGASGQTVEVEQADLAPGHADEPGVLGRPEGLVGAGTGRPGQPGQILLG